MNVLAASPLRQAVALLAVVLLIGAGACLFDAGEPPGEDLCFALVAVSAVPVLAFMLTLAGQIGPAPVLAFPLVSPDLAAPPPRA
jgi:hypothetical protein